MVTGTIGGTKSGHNYLFHNNVVFLTRKPHQFNWYLAVVVLYSLTVSRWAPVIDFRAYRQDLGICHVFEETDPCCWYLDSHECAPWCSGTRVPNNLLLHLRLLCSEGSLSSDSQLSPALSLEDSVLHIIVCDPSCRYIGPRTSILYSAITFFVKLLCIPTGVRSTTASLEEVVFRTLVPTSSSPVQRNAFIVALIRILLLH
jgi:hypothetical protein